MRLLLEELNDLDTQAYNNENTYTNSHYKEKVLAIVGKYFGPNEGKVFKITKTPHGIKISGADFRAKLPEKLDGIGLQI